MNRTVYDNFDTWGTFSESSSNTPGFHKLVQAGSHLPNKAYTWYRIDGKSPRKTTYNGLKSDRDAGNLWTFRDCLVNGRILSGDAKNDYHPSISEARNIVLNNVLGGVRNQTIDLGVALGEARQTADMISGTLVKLAKGYRKYRRGDISGALRTFTGSSVNSNWRDIPGAAANTQLALAYGVRPLINDVYSAIDTIDKRNDPWVDVHTSRSSYSIGIDRTFSTKSGPNTYVYRSLGALRSNAVIHYRVANPLLRALDTVGLINPLSVAWELVPLSFVVDWFLPVGKFIQNIVPPKGVDFIDGWVTVKASGGFRRSTDIVSPGVGWHTSMSSNEVYKLRTPLSSFPRYNVVVPDFSLSKQQVASGLALLWQAFA